MSTGPVQQGAWDWRAAGNFIGGGSGSGVLIIMAVLALADIHHAGLLRIACLLIVTGLGLVWLEIGRPWRFLNVYRNPNSSWMSRESFLATVLVPLALLTSWFQSIALLILSGIIAALFLYSQARILKAARSIAAWRAREIVHLIMTTGIVEGTGVLLIVWGLDDGLRSLVGLFDIAIFCWAIIALRLWTWLAYQSVLTKNVPVHTRSVLLQTQTPFVLMGHILPALLVFASVLFTTYANESIILTGLCLTLSGWRIKYVIITKAALNQGFAIQRSPARGAGESGPGVKPGWMGN